MRQHVTFYVRLCSVYKYRLLIHLDDVVCVTGLCVRGNGLGTRLTGREDNGLLTQGG